MNVNDFVKKYNEKPNGYDFDQHLKIKYLKLEDKINMCESIVRISSLKDGKFKAQSITEYVLLNLKLIQTYTDIDIDFDNVLTEYDSLDEIGAINGFLSTIPEKEGETITAIMSMIKGDLYENTRSLPSYIDIKLDKITQTINSFVDVSIKTMEKLSKDKTFRDKLQSAVQDFIDKNNS
jgi:hypothetical protein